jgi:hypothetical protein
VLVDDAVQRVLPALVDESRRRPAAVLEQAVAVEIAEVVQPAQGRVDLRLELAEQPERTGPVGVLAQQAEEHGSGVDRPVVAGERRRFHGGELAETQLVQHLAGLLVVLVVHLRPQPPRKQSQRVLGHRGVEGEHLERGDDAVAPEEGRVPRHAGGVVAPAVELRSQQPQVQQRAPQGAIDELLVDLDARAFRQPGIGLGTGVRHRPGLLEPIATGGARAGTAVVPVEREPHVQRARLAGIDVDEDAESPIVLGDGARAGDRRRPLTPVEAGRREPELVGPRLPAHLAERRRDDLANLEHGPEVGIEAQLQLELDRLGGMRAQRDSVEHAGGRHPPLDPQSQGEVGVGELEGRSGPRGVRGGQQPRRPTAQSQLVAAQVPAVVEIHAERMVGGQWQRAVPQGHAESVPRLDERRLREVDQVHLPHPRTRGLQGRARAPSLRAAAAVGGHDLGLLRRRRRHVLHQRLDERLLRIELQGLVVAALEADGRRRLS